MSSYQTRSSAACRKVMPRNYREQTTCAKCDRPVGEHARWLDTNETYRSDKRHAFIEGETTAKGLCGCGYNPGAEIHMTPLPEGDKHPLDMSNEEFARYQERHDFKQAPLGNPCMCVCGLGRAHGRHTPSIGPGVDAPPVNGVTRADVLNVLNKAPGSAHYQDFPGPQPIEVTRHMDFLRGNAVKYLMRAGRKGGPAGERLDLEKALQYATWALEDLTRGDESQSGNES